jgi:ADP-ribose pyrophosphatase YjhB (NUDIX family)
MGMSSREFPLRPLIGVGGVVIYQDRVLLIKRGAEPLLGEWSIPGGMLELGETLTEGVSRELKEETGIEARVGPLIELFERIWRDDDGAVEGIAKPRFHYVIADFLCEYVSGNAAPGSDATDVAYASENELGDYQLTSTATRIIKKAFVMHRELGNIRD